MPVNYTYPGVYIEELPSGVRTITGVATSIAAFVGRAKRGALNEPTTIQSYGGYERAFGGLSADSTMSYAVRDFFLNGGSTAIIVRLTKKKGAVEQAKLAVDTLALVAANSGSWGNGLRARVDHDVRPGDNKIFNLSVRDGDTGAVEVHRNVSVVSTSPRFVTRVLEQESTLVRTAALPGANRPAASAAPTGDPFADASSSKVAAADFADDGDPLDVAAYEGSQTNKTGMFALDKADIFNLLCIPPVSDTANLDKSIWAKAAAYCEERRAMLIIDPPVEWKTKDAARTKLATDIAVTSKNAAIYFPRVRQPNPLHDRQIEDFAPCGVVAGVIARTDSTRGIWKAPAGLDARLLGVDALAVPLTDAENGDLNPLGVNCLRTMPAAGHVVWGARTCDGDDRNASEWKYVPVRRVALYIEESLYRGTQWVVFEPNDEPLWAQIRLNVGAFMNTLFRQGAFQGTSSRDAYFVKCDRETTTQTDINLGIVNVLVGFAPLKPAEFVVIRIQQMAGQIAT